MSFKYQKQFTMFVSYCSTCWLSYSYVGIVLMSWCERQFMFCFWCLLTVQVFVHLRQTWDSLSLITPHVNEVVVCTHMYSQCNSHFEYSIAWQVDVLAVIRICTAVLLYMVFCCICCRCHVWSFCVSWVLDTYMSGYVLHYVCMCCYFRVIKLTVEVDRVS